MVTALTLPSDASCDCIYQNAIQRMVSFDKLRSCALDARLDHGTNTSVI